MQTESSDASSSAPVPSAPAAEGAPPAARQRRNRYPARKMRKPPTSGARAVNRREPSMEPPPHDVSPSAQGRHHPEVEARFQQVMEGLYDASGGDIHEDEAEESGKRVLQPEPDSPKLHKILAQAGMGSRLEMEQMILEGRISVNNEPAHIGQRIQYGDQVRINGKPLRIRIAPPPVRVLAYHKPVGEVVTHDDPENRPTVFRKLPRLPMGKWQSVGRLDLNTEGLLLFSNSGELVNKLTHPRFGLEREYAVRVLGALSEEERQRLLDGVMLDDGLARFGSVTPGGGEGANCWYRVTIAEGRNREVKRMFESLGHAVSRLIRIRYGQLVLPQGLRRGVWQELTFREVGDLMRLAGLHPQARPSTPGKSDRPAAGKTGRTGSANRFRREKTYGDQPPMVQGSGRSFRVAAPRPGNEPDPMRTTFGYLGADSSRKNRPGEGFSRPGMGGGRMGGGRGGFGRGR